MVPCFADARMIQSWSRGSGILSVCEVWVPTGQAKPGFRFGSLACRLLDISLWCRHGRAICRHDLRLVREHFAAARVDEHS